MKSTPADGVPDPSTADTAVAAASRMTETQSESRALPASDSVNWIAPQELLCPLCQNISRNAVITPCCAQSGCEECVRNALLSTDEEQCPFCEESGVTPDNLIPNRLLRRAVSSYLGDAERSQSPSNASPEQTQESASPTYASGDVTTTEYTAAAADTNIVDDVEPGSSGTGLLSFITE